MRTQSKIVFIAGIALSMAFTAVSLWPTISKFFADDYFQAISAFLNPGYKVPGTWLAHQFVVLLPGLTGVLLLYVAATPQRSMEGLRQITSSGRRLWTQVVWAVLLGYLTRTTLLALSITVHMPGGRIEPPIQSIIHVVSYVPSVAGIYCCLRLLFATKRRSADRWIGYVAAIAAAIAVAWIAIDLAVPKNILGLFSTAAGRYGSKDLAHLFYSLVTLIVHWVTIRAGLALARGSDFPTNNRNALANTSMLLGGFSAAIILGRLSGFAYLAPHLNALYTLPYFLLLACFAACALATAAQGLMPAATPNAAVADSTRLLPRHFALWLGASFSSGFWIDLIIGFAATAALTGVAYIAMSGIPALVAGFIFPLIIVGFLIGPIAVFVFGIVRGRPGVAAAPALIFLVVVAYRSINLLAAAHHAEQAIDEATTLNVYPFAAPARKHDFAVIEYSHDSRGDGSCSPICQRILMTSDYAVAVLEDKTGQWRVYRKARGGHLCAAPERLESYLTLLGWGYADTCITMSRQNAGNDALVIRESKSPDSPIRQLMPEGLRGEGFEFRERIEGEDKVLGRIISGSVPPPILSSQQALPTPTKMTDFEFYAAALKLPLAHEPPRDDRDMHTVVHTIESYLTDATLTPRLMHTAEDAFRGLGLAATSDQSAEPIRAAILRLWQSGDRRLIYQGLRAFRNLKHLDFAKPHIEALMQSADPEVMKDAVWALTAFKGDLEFGKVPLATLLLDGRAAAYEGDFRSVIDLLKMFDGPFPEDLRQQAKQQLLQRQDLKGEDLLVVLAILWRGNERTRTEALETMFALDGARFAEAIIAINHKSEVLSAVTPIKFWSEAEIERIVTRLPQVPDERLAEYVRFLQFQWTFKPHYGTVKRYLEDRAAALATGEAQQQEIARKIDKAARELHRR